MLWSGDSATGQRPQRKISEATESWPGRRRTLNPSVASCDLFINTIAKVTLLDYWLLMSEQWERMRQHLSTAGPDGNYPSAVTGAETDGELRELIWKLVNHCPLEARHEGCPVHMLGRLSRDSTRHLIFTMSREALLFMFESERACRTRAMAGNHEP